MKFSPSLSLALTILLAGAQILHISAQNNILKGRVLYLSSGNKPAVGVQVKEKDSNGDYSKDNGEYRLIFQTKRNGAALDIEISPDSKDGKKIELVNEKETKAAKLPASTEDFLDIIVCPAGERDYAAHKYYNILRTAADRELEKKKKEIASLLMEKEKDYQKIDALIAQLDQMQAALDSSKFREQALSIASINLDRASQLVKDAVQEIETENDVEGALKILNAEALDSVYQNASALKKKAELAIRQVIEGYEFKINLLKPQFKFGDIAECYEKIAQIYAEEKLEEELANNLVDAAYYWGLNGTYKKQLELDLKALAIREEILPSDHLMLALSYNNLGVAYSNLGELQKQLEFHLKATTIREKKLPVNSSYLAWSYGNLAGSYGELGDYKKQLEYNLKALAIWEKVIPPNDKELVRSYFNLATTYGYLEDNKKALEFNLKSLVIGEKILLPDDPDLASLYGNLGWIYSLLGEHQKALEYKLKAIAIQEKVLSSYHPHLASSYGNLAGTYGDLGEHQKGLEFLLKATAIQEKTLPADHPNLASSYNELAWTYGNIGEYQKQLEFNLKTLGIREKVLPADHPLLALSYNNVGYTYINLRQFSQAKVYFEKFQAKSANGRAFRNWAIYYALQNKKRKAVKNLQKAVLLGYNDLKWITTDDKLKSIRNEKGYKNIVKQLNKQ